MTEPDFKPGLYRHFKGGTYEALRLVRHSETEEWLVLYKNADGAYWVRPYDMFFESVEHNGRVVKRFERIPEPEEYAFLSPIE